MARIKHHPTTRSLPMVPAVYLLTNLVNGKKYVGQAANLRYRWYWHRNAAQAAPTSSYAQRTAIARAMRKHGVAQFSFTILEFCDAADLDKREVFWIAAHESLAPRGYNLTTGGRPARRVADVGARISAANKGRVKGPEWRAKLSAAHKGKVLSAETRAKISAVQRGRVNTPESNRKRSLSMLGKNTGPRTAEHIAAIKAGMSKEGIARSLAAMNSPEAREKSRISKTGQKRTPEQRARMSVGQLKRQAELRRTLSNV